MSPDFLSVVLRSASFIALFQAAGMVVFVTMFGRHLEASLGSIRRIASLSALAAIAFLVAHHVLEAARMADNMS